jgi:hypothetical protein
LLRSLVGWMSRLRSAALPCAAGRGGRLLALQLLERGGDGGVGVLGGLGGLVGQLNPVDQRLGVPLGHLDLPLGLLGGGCGGRGLAVGVWGVVDAADGWVAAECGVRSVMVVQMQPAVEGGGAFGVAGVGADVGPLG